MPAGRPPKPIEEHLKEGTYRKDRHGGALIALGERGIAAPPEHLTPTQREVFMALVDALSPMVRETDAMVLEGAAIAIVRARQADEILEDEGLVVRDEKDMPKAHPMIQVAARERKSATDILAQFGGTPASRARLGINMVNLAKTASQRMAERYDEGGDYDDDVIEGELVPDAGEEPKMLTAGDVGYDDYDEPE